MASLGHWSLCCLSLRQSPCPAAGCPVPSPGTNTHLSFHCFLALEGEGVWDGGGGRGRGAPAKGPVSSACPRICLAETGILTSYKGDPVSPRRDPQPALLAARSSTTPERRPHSVLWDGGPPQAWLEWEWPGHSMLLHTHTQTHTHPRYQLRQVPGCRLISPTGHRLWLQS